LLAAVATLATEASWIARARGLTVRALEAAIRTSAGPSSVDQGSTGAAGPDVAGDEQTGVDSATLRAALADASDDAGTVDGEPRVRFRLGCPRRVRALWRDTAELARRMAGTPLPAWQVAEMIAAEAASALPRVAAGFSDQPSEGAATNTVMATDRACDSVSSAEAREAKFAISADPRESTIGHESLDWTAIAAAIPEDVRALVDGATECDPHELDARLRRAVRAMQAVDWQTGRLLRMVADLRLFRWLGFPSFHRYVRERLGLPLRKAQVLIALERKTWQAPVLGEAYRRGELSWVRVLALLPVVAERTAAAWIERAGQVTVRRLHDEFGWALTELEMALPFSWPLPPPMGAVLATDDTQLCAPRPWEQPNAAIIFEGPASVVTLLREMIRAFGGSTEPAWQALARLLDHVRAEWSRQPRHRDPIFARDGWRCAAPACSSRRNLHDHHVRYRSRGGDNAPDNRVTVCAWHHLRGIHSGVVAAWGRAPEAVHWRLGVRGDGAPLLACVGDRYLRGDEGEQGADGEEMRR